MTDAAPAEGPVASRTAAGVVARVVENLQRAVRAPGSTLELCILCLIAEGHLIIEDFPGVGKTVLAKSVARSLDLSFSRAGIGRRRAAREVSSTQARDGRVRARREGVLPPERAAPRGFASLRSVRGAAGA